jgi:hypothetical protein
MRLRVKFTGGPRDKKTRGLDTINPPAVINCTEDCKFYNVQGHYALTEEVTVNGAPIYAWMPHGVLQSIAGGGDDQHGKSSPAR